MKTIQLHVTSNYKFQNWSSDQSRSNHACMQKNNNNSAGLLIFMLLEKNNNTFIWITAYLMNWSREWFTLLVIGVALYSMCDFVCAAANKRWVLILDWPITDLRQILADKKKMVTNKSVHIFLQQCTSTSSTHTHIQFAHRLVEEIIFCGDMCCISAIISD